MKRRLILPIAACTLCLALLGWRLYSERSNAKLRLLHELRNTANTVTGMLAGSVQTEMEGRLVSRKRLEMIFGNVVKTTNLEFILVMQEGKVIVNAGNTPQKLDRILHGAHLAKNREGDRLAGEDYSFWTKINLENCRKMPCKQPCTKHKLHGLPLADLKKLESGEYADLFACEQLVVLGFADTAYCDSLTSTNKRLLTIFLFGLLAVAATFVAWIRSIRHQILEKQFIRVKAQAEKLEELELAASGLAHETKNPLGIVRALAQRASENSDSDVRTEALHGIVEAADIATVRLGEFMSYAKVKKPELRPVSLDDCTAKVKMLLDADFKDKEVELSVAPSNFQILADNDMLTQILMNLLTNSLHACNEGDRVTIEAKHIDDRITLEVIDTGSGIETELLEEVVKPYVTGRADGHGLGLAVVRRMCEESHWELCVDSQVGKGTRVAIAMIKQTEA